MRFVAFETSSEWCSVAVFVDGDIDSVELRDEELA